MDLIGHDVNFAVTRSVFEAYFGDPRFTPSLIQQELVNAGHLGRKSGRGFYDHAEGALAPVPATEAPALLANGLALWTGEALGQAWAGRLAAAGVPFTAHDVRHSDARVLRVGETLVHLTDGRSATQRAADNGHEATVLADLTLDLLTATRIALARADNCSEAAFKAAAAVFQAAGLAVSRLDDVPGLAVMRTVAMLANEAADAVSQGVCDAAAADLALQKGVDYPRGPLAGADAIGLPKVMAVLDHLARSCGEDRYRCSNLIRRKVSSGSAFHAAAAPKPLVEVTHG